MQPLCCSASERIVPPLRDGVPTASNGLTLRRFEPRSAASATVWTHSVRSIDGAGRLALPELLSLGTAPAARLCGTRWEITGSRHRPGATPVALDVRRRILVPSGIRQQVGLDDLAVVSATHSLGRIVLWAPAILDRFLEES